jgi:hypothetical protein
MMMDKPWNDKGRGKFEVLGRENVSIPINPPQIPHGLSWYQIPDPAVTNCYYMLKFRHEHM